MRQSRARWNTAWAWTSAPDLPRLVATSTEAAAEAVSARGHTRKQYEHSRDQSDDCRQTKRKADPVGNRSQDNRNQDSDHSRPLLRWWRGTSRGNTIWNPKWPFKVTDIPSWGDK